jgi:hypothetical protein
VEVLVVFLVFLLLLAGGALVVRNWWAHRGHGQLLAALAAERGLTYVPRDDRQVRPIGHPFGIGRKQRADNVLYGEVDGRRVMAFDYSFELRWWGQLWLPVRYGVVLVRLPVALPEMEVVEEGPQDKASTFLGLDFVVTHDADFNERFRVRAQDKDLAQEVLSRWTQEALLQRPPLRLRIRGHEAFSWKRGRLLPHELDVHLDSLAALVDGIPPTVWIDYRDSA